MATLVASLGIVTAAFPTSAQDFPNRNITMIVPFPAGGPIDATARFIAQPLSERLGKPVIIENIGGAGTSIGSLRVARSAPDGHTLLLQNLALAASGTLYPQSGLDPARNFATISFIASTRWCSAERTCRQPRSLT